MKTIECNLTARNKRRLAIKQSTRAYIWQELKKEFGDDVPEITNARIALSLAPLPCDLIGACAKDPLRCVLAKCFRRMYPGSRFIMFWKRTAYAHLPGKDGVYRIYRYKISAAAFRILDDFDKGKTPFLVGQSITIDAMPRSANPALRRRKDRINNVARQKLNNRRFKLRERARLAAQAVKVSNTPQNRAALRAAETAVENFKKSHPTRRLRPSSFDLTTRNGARGNYSFQVSV